MTNDTPSPETYVKPVAGSKITHCVFPNGSPFCDNEENGTRFYLAPGSVIEGFFIRRATAADWERPKKRNVRQRIKDAYEEFKR